MRHEVFMNNSFGAYPSFTNADEIEQEKEKKSVSSQEFEEN